MLYIASETCIFAIRPKNQNVNILLHLKLPCSQIQVCEMKIVSRPQKEAFDQRGCREVVRYEYFVVTIPV